MLNIWCECPAQNGESFDIDGLDGISRDAKKDLSESIAEIGVLKERGDFDDFSDNAKELFEKYFGV
ncbi:MAG: hypothetical protein ACI4AA_05920 [Lachnospiraceae bacterium]